MQSAEESLHTCFGTCLIPLISAYNTPLVLDGTWCNRAGWATVQTETRASSERARVDAANGCAAQTGGQTAEQGGERLQLGGRQASNARKLSKSKFRGEAKRVGSNLRGSVSTAGEGMNVDRIVGVDLALVATDRQDLWLKGSKLEQVGLDCENWSEMTP